MKKYIISIVIVLAILICALLSHFLKIKVKTIEMYNENYSVSIRNLDNIYFPDFVFLDESLSYISHFNIDNKEINYNLFISYSGGLWILDIDSGKSYEISSDTFKSIYIPDENNYSEVFAYALSSSSILYKIELNSLDISKTKLNQVPFAGEIARIAKYKEEGHYLFGYNKQLLIQTPSFETYDAGTNYLIDNLIYNIENKFVIYYDDTLAFSNGKSIILENGEPLKVSTVIKVYNSKDFEGKPNYMFITPDFHLVYLANNKLYISKTEVNILTDNDDGIVHIEFDDKTVFNIKGTFYVTNITYYDSYNVN